MEIPKGCKLVPVGRFIEPGPTYSGAERIPSIRSYSEYSEACVIDSKGYWIEGEKVFSQSQISKSLAFDEAKERELFEDFILKRDGGFRVSALDGDPCYTPAIEHDWHVWESCAQSRAKSAEAETCQHDWVDARNAVIKSGELCAKCLAIRSGNITTDDAKSAEVES